MDNCHDDESGRWSQNLPSGTYRVGYSAPGHVDEYFEGADALEGATDVEVAPGGTRTDLDASLALDSTIGAISGTVTGPDGSPRADVGVQLLQYDIEALDWTTVESVETGSDGTWQATVRAGTYRVAFTEDSFDTQYYDGACSVEDAADVEVTAGGTRAEVDAQLGQDPARGRIAGTVTGPDGTPLSGVSVTVFEDGEALDQTTSGQDGTWSASVPPGTYRVGFAIDSEQWAAEYHEGAATLDAATDVVVDAGGTSTVDAQLAPRPDTGTLSGSVTRPGGSPLDGADVELYRYDEDYGWQAGVLAGHRPGRDLVDPGPRR